jgi:hypothetical protein
MSCTLDFSDDALLNIDQICGVLDQFSAAGGANFLVELSEMVILLERFPSKGKKVDGKIRRVVLAKSNYNIYYKINAVANEIRLLSIIYGPHVR